MELFKISIKARIEDYDASYKKFFQDKRAAFFEKQGGTYLLLDEVHKYPQWSREIKLIYDDFPDLHVVFTSSSNGLTKYF